MIMDETREMTDSLRWTIVCVYGELGLANFNSVVAFFGPICTRKCLIWKMASTMASIRGSKQLR